MAIENTGVERMKTEQLFAAAGALLAAASVTAGAFGSHVLKQRLPPEMLGVFETGVRYQMHHALALLAVAWAYERWAGPLIQSAGWFFIAGMVMFCGSLYALAFSRAGWWGAVTPVGGAAIIAGWILLGTGVWKSKA